MVLKAYSDAPETPFYKRRPGLIAGGIVSVALVVVGLVITVGLTFPKASRTGLAADLTSLSRGMSTYSGSTFYRTDSSASPLISTRKLRPFLIPLFILTVVVVLAAVAALIFLLRPTQDIPLEPVEQKKRPGIALFVKALLLLIPLVAVVAFLVYWFHVRPAVTETDSKWTHALSFANKLDLPNGIKLVSGRDSTEVRDLLLVTFQKCLSSKERLYFVIDMLRVAKPHRIAVSMSDFPQNFYPPGVNFVALPISADKVVDHVFSVPALESASDDVCLRIITSNSRNLTPIDFGQIFLDASKYISVDIENRAEHFMALELDEIRSLDTAFEPNTPAPV